MASSDWAGNGGTPFTTRPTHRAWLLDQARTLFALFQTRAFNPKGGFFGLGEDGTPMPAPGPGGEVRGLHDTTRMVHCFAMAHLLGLPGADRMIDHGMAFLSSHHHDQTHGGWFWQVDDRGAVDATKQAYGHAFVLLAASSAMVVGHPDAAALLADVTEVLLRRFWDDKAGATTEEYAADWAALGPYRGQNSNMHLTEALMAAYEASGNRTFLTMAERIAGLIINCHARAEGWRVAEHFDADWQVDRGYEGNPMFRPAGTTPGHALEWSRLLVQLWELGGRKLAWLPEAAEALFLNTCAIGWDNDTGGFYYTLDWNDRPSRPDRYWWPCAEAIAAASVLRQISDNPAFEAWYRRVWSFAANHLIDWQHGGWFPELGPDLKPVNRVFTGKPDLYHAVQACLIPLLPATGSATRGLLAGLPFE